MEDVLTLYEQPANLPCPVVCFDEKPVQPMHDTRQLLPAQAGCLECYDYEYKCMKDLVDVYFPEAAVIHVVLVNLNTHTLAALQDGFWRGGGAADCEQAGVA